jgi:hypothetical protein
MKSTDTKTDPFAKARAAKAAKAAATGHSGPPLTEDQVLQRERAFAIYRDFGRSRTIHKLHRVLSEEHPDLLATKVTLGRWSKRHNWAERAAAFDRGIILGQQPPPIPVKTGADPEFNSIDALLSAAQMALTKAMNANPVVTRPGDVKILVDAATNAMKLVETLEHKQAGKGAANEIAADIARICDLVEKARRKDIDEICRAVAKTAADMSGQPIEPILQAAMNTAGLYLQATDQQQTAQVDDVVVDPVDPAPAMVETGEQKPTLAMVSGGGEGSVAPQIPMAAPLPSFSDVLAQINGGKQG